jgi:hypothetical protein
MKKIFTLLLVLITVSSYAQKVKLELRLQKDSTYYLTMNAKLDIDQFIQNTHQIAKTTVSGKMAHKVVSIQDTSYTMEIMYRSIALNMDIAGKTLDFDSNGDTTNILSRAMKNIIDKPFTLIISRRGEVIAVKNSENLFQNLFSGFPPIDDQKKAQLLAQLQQSFGDKAIRSNFQEAFVIFPKAPVALKGTWTSQTSMAAAAISAKTKTTYTLDNVTDKFYEISGSAVVMPDKAAAFKITNGYFMRLANVNGTNKTTLKVDKHSGWLIESNVVKDVKGTIEAKQTLAGPIIMSYPMVVSGVLTNNGN